MTKYQEANSLMLLAAFANDVVIEYIEFIKSNYYNVAALELAEAKYNGAAKKWLKIASVKFYGATKLTGH